MSYRGDMQAGFGGNSTPFGHIDEWAELAVDYVDGTVSEADQALIEQHLAVCPSCAARLAEQTEVRSLFAATDAVEAPSSLEDRILGELLFPSQVVARPEPKDPGVESLWRRRLRAWMPASVAVAAVLVGLVVWGIFGPGQKESFVSTTSTMVASAESTQAKEANQPMLGAGAGAADSYASTAAPATTAAARAETSTTTAAATTTMSATVTAAAAAGPVPTTIVDKKAMVAALKQAAGPVYLAFTPTAAESPDGSANADTDTAAAGATAGEGANSYGPAATAIPGTGQSPVSGQASSEWVQELMAEVTSFTEMTPLPDSIADGESVFAGYLDHRNVTAFIELLQSIATSHQVRVTLQNEPSPQDADTALRIGEHKAELPVLICHVVPQPATYRNNFTTSTLPASGTAGGQAAPDEAGTHVLTVVFFQR